MVKHDEPTSAMTLRDYFAAHVSEEPPVDWRKELPRAAAVARWKYKHADEMLEERKRGAEPVPESAKCALDADCIDVLRSESVGAPLLRGVRAGSEEAIYKMRVEYLTKENEGLKRELDTLRVENLQLHGEREDLLSKLRREEKRTNILRKLLDGTRSRLKEAYEARNKLQMRVEDLEKRLRSEQQRTKVAYEAYERLREHGSSALHAQVRDMASALEHAQGRLRETHSLLEEAHRYAFRWNEITSDPASFPPSGALLLVEPANAGAFSVAQFYRYSVNPRAMWTHLDRTETTPINVGDRWVVVPGVARYYGQAHPTWVRYDGNQITLPSDHVGSVIVDLGDRVVIADAILYRTDGTIWWRADKFSSEHRVEKGQRWMPVSELLTRSIG